MNDNVTPVDTKSESSVPRLPVLYRKYYFFTLIVSLLGAAIQMVLLLSKYDIAVGLYQRDSALVTFFAVFVLLVTAFIATMPLLCRKEKQTELQSLPPADTPVIFASTLCGFILIAVMILQLMLGSPFSGVKGLDDYFWIAVLALLIPTALFFFLPALPVKLRPEVHTALAFFPVLWCAAYLLCVFFHNGVALNSPVRTLTELAMIGSMLFFLTELRVRVGKPNAAYLMTFVNIAIFYSTICAIPLISVAFINQWELTTDLLYSAVQLCFLTYFIARANTIIRTV